jgi:L-fucose isomerase-like protein
MEVSKMKEKAINIKLVVRPIIGCLTHSHFWEGPCRAGHKEDMTPEVEKKAADAAFARAVKELEKVKGKIDFLAPIDARYNEKFVLGEDVFTKIEEDIDKVDFFLCMNWRIPKLERYKKPIVIMQNGNEGIDFAAYCRSIGVEAYVAMDVQDLNEIAHLLWVRKAVANTRALVLTAGSQPTFGIQSLIRDPEIIRQRYGMEIVKLPFRDIFPYMDQITDEEAKPIADKLINGSKETKVNKDWFINDIKYYLAAKKMMDVYQCNAFSTACHELCTSEIPQNRKFTPCVCHSVMKDEGIPSGCEEDLNALLAMTIMQYAANRPAFMGNPSYETDELLKIHHAVPALCMNGYGTKPLSYKLWAFTGQGFGGKLQVDFAENKSNEVTLARFNPQGDTMCVKVGEVIRSEYDEVYCSPYYYIKMDDARTYMHNLAGFGHHQVLIFGDYLKELKAIAKIMNFNILEG